MVKKNIFRVLAILSGVFLIIPFFGDIWLFQIDETVQGDGFGLFDKFRQEIYNMFNLGGQKFQTLGATLVSVFSVIALVLFVVFVIITILNFLNKGNNKLKSKILLYNLFAMLAVMVVLFVSIMLFTGNNASIQMPLTDTYVNVYMVATINAYFLILGLACVTLFGFLSLINKNKLKDKKVKS